MTGRKQNHRESGADTKGCCHASVDEQQADPAPLPVTYPEVRGWLRRGGYLRSVLVEGQMLERGSAVYSVYVVGSWHPDWHAFHVAYPARKRTFRSLDRLMSLLRVDLGYQGDIVLRVEGRYAKAGRRDA
ncbi:hypothetical protein ACI2KH_18410 [Roseomonas mucosa]|uniref:hypothetical protein n=1 Tax=Roseomonas mucosa TaxID=207340 RepID=UPI001D780F35|nr:hypothetical protein [Roseomonas mucosa]MBS5903756.1 hypothetical protein [Acetobacteraceae bacterium]MCG7352544.1 hypothetical protein [Roseomonas mucosa]